MNSINKQALVLDLDKVKVRGYENFTVTHLHLVDQGMYRINMNIGSFSSYLTGVFHIDDTNIKQLLIEQAIHDT